MERKYRDSGIPWMKYIPADWNVVRGKDFLFLRNRSVREDDDVVTCFRDGEVILRNQRRTEGFTMSDKEIGYQGINKGDIVIHGMDGFAGAMGVSKSTGKGSPVLIVCNPKSDDDARYIIYYLRSLAMNNVFVALATGIRERSCDLRWNKISVLPFVRPSSVEQTIIADYIDKKCGEIDSLIALQEQMIEKLKVYKQSVITEAVTKGLDPNAKLVPSGIDWIGDIPEGWRILRIKKISSDYKAGPFGSALITGNLLHEGSILVYTPEHVADTSKISQNINNLYLQEERREEMSQFFVKAGDVVFPIVGSLGRAIIIDENMPEGIINQRLSKFSINREKIDEGYFMWLFGKSEFYAKYIEMNCRGSFIVNLTKVIVGDMPLPLPSLCEQQAIASYLNGKCADIDHLIALKQQKIESLKDYKKSVIYEAVTGKTIV